MLTDELGQKRPAGQRNRRRPLELIPIISGLEPVGQYNACPHD